MRRVRRLTLPPWRGGKVTPMTGYDSAVKAVFSSADWLEATIRMEDLARLLAGLANDAVQVDVPALRKDLADLVVILDRLDPNFAAVTAADAAGG